MLGTAELSLIEQRVTNEGPRTGVAYLLWFFLGLFSAHRFYLGKPITALLQIASYFILIGFLWWLLDAFMIPGIIREKNQSIRQLMTNRLLAREEKATALEADPAAVFNQQY